MSGPWCCRMERTHSMPKPVAEIVEIAVFPDIQANS